MRKQVIKYGLYAFSSLIGVMIIVSAYYSFFVEHVVGLVSFIASVTAGILCIPLVFIAIARQSRLTRQQVLKIAVGLWLIGVLAPVAGL